MLSRSERLERTAMEMPERFQCKVQKTGGCWIWTGADNGNGYGVYSVARGKWSYAHRLAFEWANGSIPDGLVVCHTCDVKRCVNPAHLFLGTQADNVHDMIKKGRGRNQNTGKMVCKRGHALEGDNLISRNGMRQCRSCQRMHWRAYRERQACA